MKYGFKGMFVMILVSCLLWAGEAVVSIPETYIQKNGEGLLEIVVQSNEPVSGLQMTMKFNPQQVQILNPTLNEANQELQINSRVKEGSVTIIAFSMTGSRLVTDQGAVIRIPVKPMPGYEGRLDLDLSEVILASPKAQTIPLAKTIGEIRVTQNLPKVFKVEPNYPNPFNPETVIKYQIPKSSQVLIKVYNLNGQEIRTLESSVKEPGYYQIIWNGRNDDGKLVASGEYILSVLAGEFTHTRKMVFLK